MTAKTAPSLEEIQAAQRRIAGIARVTPVYSSETFSRLTGRPVHLKAENLQRTGAFKIRGAVNRIALLTPEEHAAGVVTASAGNHGQAVAWAAREAGVLARIFMPHHTPMAKIERPGTTVRRHICTARRSKRRSPPRWTTPSPRTPPSCTPSRTSR